MDLTGGGAFYSLTPRRDLADLGLNELRETPHIGKDIERYPSKGCSQAEGKSLLLERRCHEVTEDLGLNELKANPPYPSFKKVGIIPAFTLAEVLVTLGLIGVVAAMTIPMLAKNYKFFVLQQQFKKVYAALSVAVQKTQIDMGEGVKCFSYNDVGNTYVRTDCAWFYSELAKNLQVITTCRGNLYEQHCLPAELRGGDKVYGEMKGGDDPQAMADYFNGAGGCGAFGETNLKSNSIAYVVNPNFIIVPYARISSNQFYTQFFVDINGHKGPNKWGHDVFIFGLDKSHKYESVFKLIPSKRCHAVDKGGYYTKDFVEYLYGRNAEL